MFKIFEKIEIQQIKKSRLFLKREKIE